MLGRQNGVDTSDNMSSGGTSGVTFDSTKHGFRSNNTDSEGSEFSVSLGNRSTPVYNHSLNFPLSELAHTGNSLHLFENTSSTDFLCGDLPEIGSFEDVDRMFRRSDSTFGLVDSKEDEFGWLSSESDKGESGESLQSDFGFPCQETSMRQNVSENHSFSNRNTELSEAPISIHGSCIQEKSDSYTSLVNGLGICDANYGSIPEEQMNECKKQLKQLNHMVEKRKEHNFGNLPNKLNKLSSRTTSLQGYPSAHMSPQLRATGPNSFFYLQNNDSQPYSDNSQLSSNQIQCMGSSHDPRSLLTGISATDSGADIHTFQSNLSSQNVSLMDQSSIQDPGLVGKQVKLCGDKFENPTDALGVSLVIPLEPGSSNVQESSMTKMGVDDISLAAASFCQLQLVMEWLDLGAKLCIRDGLYRLARGAEQRINHANQRGSCNGVSFMAEETKNCASLINMETGTNPIDRAIAQLLFNRPSNPSVLFTHDV